MPEKKLTTVDLFSGCGGLSLGFDLAKTFETKLALDLDEDAVEVWNANRNTGVVPTCRRIDLADFRSGPEVVAFWLLHLAAHGPDPVIDLELPAQVREAVDLVAGADAWYVATCADRDRSSRGADADALSLRLVMAFHDKLGLPATSGQALPPWVWTASLGHNPVAPATAARGLRTAVADRKACALGRARAGLKALKRVAKTKQSGQFATAARRVSSFLRYAKSADFEARLDEWSTWVGVRNAIRDATFSDPGIVAALRAAYRGDRRVDVVLGGPPCTGFSSAGRGKAASMREQGVHSNEDDETGDARNGLFRAYVRFVSALAPRAFLFENVKAFETDVEAANGTFSPADELRKALAAGGTDFVTASRVLDAAKHGVPQTRLRFFMVGVRGDAVADVHVAAEACLDLPESLPVTVGEALAGLPEAAGLEAMQAMTVVDGPASVTDAHVARAPRADDAALFALFGQGRRWSDYRCDGSSTLAKLAGLVRAVAKAGSASVGVDPEELAELMAAVDGSLSLRLMLEAADSEHHLLAPAYMAKGPDNHGDWLARLPVDGPARTLTAHLSKDGYAFVHPWLPRSISVREAARLQSFPDSFRFGAVSATAAWRLIGNAVPPLLARALALRLSALFGRSQGDTESC